jgi:hypothetical protein
MVDVPVVGVYFGEYIPAHEIPHTKNLLVPWNKGFALIFEAIHNMLFSLSWMKDTLTQQG